MTDTSVVTIVHMLYITTRAKVNSKPEIYTKGGRIYGVSGGDGHAFVEENDTLYMFIDQESTLFRIDKSHLLRSFDKVIILNYLESTRPPEWTTLMLEKTRKNGIRTKTYISRTVATGSTSKQKTASSNSSI